MSTVSADRLTLASQAGQWAIAATVAGSAVAQITATVVNVALPEIAAGLDAGTLGVQWVINAYMLPLASLILIGGALGDRYGRRRIYLLGTIIFGASSLAAAVAPSLGFLLGARVVMGVGGALLTPGSLAILEASFVKKDRAAAIGAWAGLGGVAGALGPVLGGLLLDLAGWRLLFLLNLPICAAAVYLTVQHLPESTDPDSATHRIDWAGTVTGAAGLAALTYGLISLGGGISVLGISAIVAGIAIMFIFVTLQRQVQAPLVPLSMFSNRTFSVANILTFVVYAALGGVFFLLVVFLRQVLGYSGFEAGAATLPMTILMLLFSAQSGRVASRIGPRLQLTAGPVFLAVGMLLFSRLEQGSSYGTDVFPGVVLFGFGLVCLVAPVTATVLAAADERRAGLASGINNAVARTAGLMAVAILPPAAGLGAEAFNDPTQFAAGFSRAMLISAVLAAVGAVVAGTGLESTLRTRRRDPRQPEAHEHPHTTIDCPAPVRQTISRP